MWERTSQIKRQPDSFETFFFLISGTSRYRVVVYSNSENSTTMINVTRARITINDLVPGTWYNFRIYSRTKSGLENPVGSEIVRVQTGT